MKDTAKNILLWVIIAFAVLSMFNYFSPKQKADTSISYTTFIQAINQGNIRQVSIDGPVISGMLNDGDRFTTFNPGDPHLIDDLLKNHYADLSSKPFFPSLIEYMRSGPVVPMCWEGDGVVKAGRVLLGATKPSESAPGSIRGDLCIDVGRNICHGSDSVESADKEIALWFKPEELVDWKSHSESWIYEK